MTEQQQARFRTRQGKKAVKNIVMKCEEQLKNMRLTNVLWLLKKKTRTLLRKYPLKYLGVKDQIFQKKKIYTEWKERSTKDKTSSGKCKQQTKPDKRIHVFLYYFWYVFVSLKLFSSEKNFLKE